MAVVVAVGVWVGVPVFVAVDVGPGVGVFVIVGSTSGVPVGSSVTGEGKVAVAPVGVKVGVTTGVVEVADRVVGAVTSAIIPRQ
jgi:hypothetical protein